MPLTTVSFRLTNTREVTLAVQRKLQNRLADIFPEEAILLADPEQWDDGPPASVAESSFLAVCPGDSQFPEDVQSGAVPITVEEIGTAEVTIYSSMRLDRTGSMPAAVWDETEGLLELKRRVILALAGADLTGDNALPLLSQLIPVRTADKPRKDSTGRYYLKVVFGICYFWDLEPQQT